MVTLNEEQAKLVLAYLNAVKSNFKGDRGMNIGSATIHNIYPNELRMADEIIEKINASL